MLETVPGLIVTLHSGEGKANQYLMRGYNLDHGTDLETYVDGMPINQPTHAHGQGYTDLNFVMPELAEQLTYTKGPYTANVGDFGAVGSVRVSYRDTIEDQVSATVGTLNFQRVFAAGSEALGSGNILTAVEVQHYDGPFLNPDDARKENIVLRYSQGDDKNGYSITAMAYHQLWTNTTDIPIRAITEGLVADRFGTLDPTDGGRAWRSSLSFDDHATIGSGQFIGSAFLIDNQLHMFNDFTHFLVDPCMAIRKPRSRIAVLSGVRGVTRCRCRGARSLMSFPWGQRCVMTCCTSSACRARAWPCCRQRRPPMIRRRFPMMIRCTCSLAGCGFRRPRAGPRNFAACSDFARTINTVPTSTTWPRYMSNPCRDNMPDTAMAVRRGRCWPSPKGASFIRRAETRSNFI